MHRGVHLDPCSPSQTGILTAMTRRTTLAAIAVAILVFLPSCRREDNSIPPVETQDRIIQTATQTDDPSMLVLTWDPAPCETFQEVEVELTEDFANLTIRVIVDVDTCPPGGFDQTTVDLGEPLGDREVWDRAFGNTVALNEPPQF